MPLYVILTIKVPVAINLYYKVCIAKEHMQILIFFNNTF